MAIHLFLPPSVPNDVTSILQISDEGAIEGLTTQNFRPLFSKAHFSVVFGSLSLAFATAFLCLLVAFPIAHFIAFRGKRYKTLLLFFLIVPFWTNFLLHVHAWFFVLEREGIACWVLVVRDQVDEF